MKAMEKSVIAFDVKATELLHYCCQGVENKYITERILFVVDNKWYYLYAYTRTEKVPSYSLREITPEEYNMRSLNLLNLYSKQGLGEWQDLKGNSFSLKLYKQPEEACCFSKNIAQSACVFMSKDGPLTKIHDHVLLEKQLKENEENVTEQEKRYNYSRECGTLSQRYGIPFVNVLRIGTNVNNLKRFKETYYIALKNIPSMPLEDQRYIYQAMFQDKTRVARISALNKLGVEFFDADVRNMDFTELEKVLNLNLNDYIKKSERLAIKNSIEFDYSKREELYNKLNQLSRTSRKEALATLGVDINAININFYPRNRIIQTLAQSLGFEYEA